MDLCNTSSGRLPSYGAVRVRNLQQKERILRFDCVQSLKNVVGTHFQICDLKVSAFERIPCHRARGLVNDWNEEKLAAVRLNLRRTLIG